MPDLLPDEPAPRHPRGGPALFDVLPGARLEPFASGVEEAVDWRRWLSAVVRYRWWIVALAALGTAVGTASSRLLPPRFVAQATIWIQAPQPRAIERGPIGGDQLLTATAWVDLLRSYVVLDSVARELRLFLHTDRNALRAFATFAVADNFRPGRYRLRVDRAAGIVRLEGDDGTELDHAAVGDSIGRALGLRWAPSADMLASTSSLSFTMTPLRDAARWLGDGLVASTDPGGNFLRISLTATSGQAAATTVNAIARRYVAVASELKSAKLTELSRLLAEQLGTAEGNLRRAENVFEEFRGRTITLAPEPNMAVGGAGGSLATPWSDFFALRLELDQLRRDRQAIAQLLSQIGDSGGAVEALGAVGAVQRSASLTQALAELTTRRAELRAVRYRYTDAYAPVQRLTQEIQLLATQTVPALARGLSAELGARQHVLASQVEAGGRALRDIPQRMIDEARLRRDVTVAENLYASVQQRYNEARLAEASSVADVGILDAAVAPQVPLKDAAARLMGMGFVAGLGLGLLGAVLIDRFDPRLRHPDQVTYGMGLRILGVLPHVRDRRVGQDDEHVIQLVEAVRSVRLSLAHAYGAAGPMVVTLTSPGVGDGKSFLSANLALAFAEAGHRTLLVDGDVRRGALHRALHATRQPGLTDFLAGRAPLEAIVQETTSPSLHFIGSGTRHRDAPELLGSPPMVELLTRLRTSHRVILVDSPPLGSGVDPLTLGTLTGSLLLVLRAGASNLDLTRTKLALLELLPIRLLGVVLNDVPAAGAYRYYSYLTGYEAVDEPESVAVQRVRALL